MKCFKYLLFLVFSLLIMQAQADNSGVQTLPNKTVKLTSLEWPPYTGTALTEKGATVAVAKAAFAAEGYELIVEFFPWKRTVHLAKNSPDYDGYFPEYYAKELEDEFILSDAMGSGPLGFAERKADPVTWDNLNDLKNYKFGVVNGYVNTEEFDSMVASGELKADGANDDERNLLKLASGRIDLVLIDKNVMDFLLSTEPKLEPIASKIQFNQRILEDKKLFICFKKSERGKQLAEIFNAGLKKVDVNAIMQRLLNN